MCDFFSFMSDPAHQPGQKYYFDWQHRKEHLDDDCDSHSMIAKHFQLDEDGCNKYEYNPLTGEFRIDQINATDDDSLIAEEWVSKLNFKRIVEPLIVKPIVNPFDLPKQEIGPDEILLLQQWASTGYSVRDSVWNSVRASVGNSVRASVGNSVGGSVGYSVGASVRYSVRYSVGAGAGYSVWDSVWDSAEDSMWAYTLSFFDIEHKHDFLPAVKLWEQGIVPSFDGNTWRLHSGKDAEVVFEITKDELEKYK